MRVTATLFVAILLASLPATALAPATPESVLEPSAPAAPVAHVLEASAPAGAAVDQAADLPPPGAPVSAARARADAAAAFGTFVDEAGIDAASSHAPEGIRNMALLFQQPNGTNGTVLDDANGTHSHRHGAVGGDGLAQVWARPFHGIGRVLTAADVDGDGVADTVAGSDISVTAVSGKDGRMLWARHLGSAISSVAVVDLDGDGRQEVLYSSQWHGQRARVELLDGPTGHPRWYYEGGSSFLTAGAAGDGDVLAIDTRGDHHRIDGSNGEALHVVAVDLLPNTGALVAGHFNLGHYLGRTADINGDGVMDTVSAGAYLYYAFGLALFTYNMYTIVHAVDGATGEVLWISPVTAEPNPDGFTLTMLTDMEALDHDGDGRQDLAYAGYSFRWFSALSLAGIWWESFLRVVDSDQPVAPPVSTKEMVSPLLSLEFIADIEPIDLGGDGRYEVGVLRRYLVDALLDGVPMSYERFAFLPNAASQTTAVLLSDVKLPLNATASLRGVPDLHLVLSTSDGAGFVTAVGMDGEVAWQTHVRSGGVAAADVADGRLHLATRAHVEQRSGTTFADVDAAFPMRGTPLRFVVEDFDGDSFADAWIASSDGNVHVLDGLTGQVLDTIDIDATITHIQPAQVRKDGTDWLIVRQSGYEQHVELWNSETRTSQWSVPLRAVGPVWLDANGDGVLDVFSEWDASTSRITITDGRDGKPVVSDTIATPGTWFRPRYAEVLRDQDGPDRLVLIDSRNGVVVVDGQGQRPWSHPFDGYVYRLCVGTADVDGDGRDSLAMIMEQDGIRGTLLDWDGNASSIGGLPRIEWLVSCSLDGVPAAGRDDLLVGLTYMGSDYEFRSGFGRWSDGEWGWKRFGRDSFDEIGGIVPLGVDAGGDGGRFFYGEEDHVVVARWSDGESLGQFTLDGPFVRSGVVLDLDRRAPAEVLALAQDGMLWALATDADAVAGALAREAERQGKQPATVDPVEEGKRSPAPLGLALLALALLGRRRR